MSIVSQEQDSQVVPHSCLYFETENGIAISLGKLEDSVCTGAAT